VSFPEKKSSPVPRYGTSWGYLCAVNDENEKIKVEENLHRLGGICTFAEKTKTLN
jgi:hypothetical protein